MSHQGLDALRVHIGVNQKASVRVPKVMKANMVAVWRAGDVSS